MKILIVGGGGREHALAWRIANNPSGTRHKIYCAPGNAGMTGVAEPVAIQATDVEGLCAFAKRERIEYTIVGMDAPLALGLADRFASEGLDVFGPKKAAAMLESSKAYAKRFMKKYGIPTAEYAIFDTYEAASEYIRKSPMPIVVKADGLAFGKGALVCKTQEEAEAALRGIMIDKQFGESGNRVVIEKFLTGKETSIMTFCDGEHIVPMVSAKDYKNAFDGDIGPNTGGMGAVSPSPYYTENDAMRFEHEIMLPTLKGIKAEGLDYVGFLYFGLMLTDKGPYVIEYNARFGDPEAQAVLPRLKTDLLEICKACNHKSIDKVDIRWDNKESACICLVSEGYPLKYETGFTIEGLDRLQKEHNDALVFFAGVRAGDNGFETDGGRVIGITCLDGEGLAARKAYEAASVLSFAGMRYRTDIGPV